MIVVGQAVVEWVAKRTHEFGNFGCAVGIGWARGGELIAGVAFNEFNGVNINMHVSSDGTRQWMTREYLWACFHYPFEQAKVKRITGLVGEGNRQSQRFNEHLGLRLEATLEGAHPTGDLLIYRMRKADCRFLREPYAKPTRTDLLRAAA